MPKLSKTSKSDSIVGQVRTAGSLIWSLCYPGVPALPLFSGRPSDRFSPQCLSKHTLIRVSLPLKCPRSIPCRSLRISEAVVQIGEGACSWLRAVRTVLGRKRFTFGTCSKMHAKADWNIQRMSVVYGLMGCCLGLVWLFGQQGRLEVNYIRAVHYRIANLLKLLNKVVLTEETCDFYMTSGNWWITVFWFCSRQKG